MTHSPPPGEPPPAALSAADGVLAASTATLLFLAPAAGSAGLRGAMLAIGGAALVWSRGSLLGRDLREVPRGFALAFCAWALLAALSVRWSVNPAAADELDHVGPPSSTGSKRSSAAGATAISP